MGASTRVVDHHSEQVLQQLAERELQADRAKRLRTVLLAKQGFTAPEIATCTGFSRGSIQKWVARYNAAELVRHGIRSRSQATADARTSGTFATATRCRSVAERRRLHAA